MKAFLLILLVSMLTGCAKKAPDKPAGNTTPNNTSTTNTGTKTGTTTGTSTGTNTGTNTGTTTKTDSLSYLALGDSYTIGQSVLPVQSFPYQLTGQLNLQTKVSVPTIIATTGWTTYNLINGINNSGLTTKTYDFVTLLIGVNDQFQGVNQDTYRVQFINVLNTAIRFARGNKSRVFVISIPDYSVTPFANFENAQQLATIALEIDEFNAINKNESVKAGVNYQDITDISRQAANDPSLITTDGLHPSGKMYALWVQRLAPLIKAQLAK